MEKYFAISDVHGCASYAKKAVKKAGFDPKNPNHFLVVLGDVFDRGTENEAAFEWLSSLKNVILVRGNHEQLMKEMIERGYPIGRDVHNGTCDTVLEIMGHTRKELSDALDKAAPMPDFDGGCAALKKNMEKRAAVEEFLPPRRFRVRPLLGAAGFVVRIRNRLHGRGKARQKERLG